MVKKRLKKSCLIRPATPPKAVIKAKVLTPKPPTRLPCLGAIFFSYDSLSKPITAPRIKDRVSFKGIDRNISFLLFSSYSVVICSSHINVGFFDTLTELK